MLYPILAVAMNLVRLAHADAHGAFLAPSLLLPALLLLFPAVWLMGTISAAIAIRADFVMNLLICFAVFFLGLIAQYFATSFLGSGFLSGLVSGIVPNWQYFWMADALANRSVIPFSYLLMALLYALFYGGIWFVWALYLFRDAELAKDNR